MAGKSYIKVGYYDWDRIKRMYIKTGGQTWSAIRKAYVKTNAGLWKKVFDTTSNRPFLEGNDIPKLRLNTFRTGSSSGSIIDGTADDPIDPVVEAPPVQRMGPTQNPPSNDLRSPATAGWVGNQGIGRHLWGYNGDWVSGNGSTITYAYDWLFSTTGDLNYVEKEFLATSSTGRRDMITNSSTHLGRDDGDYFDKNWIIFRVRATNSAGNASAQAAPVYIVRQRPSGTIDVTNTGVDVPETLAANITYASYWYNKPDVYDSYVEWFAVDALGDALTVNNRVAIEDLYNITVTGTTTKSGTVYHYAELQNKIYIARLTLNNSNTQAPVVPVTGFIPSSPFTAEDSTSPGSALEVTDLSFLDYNNNEGTDNRGYIPVGGLVKFKAEVQGVDGSTTYRIRYRMYNWQNRSYYGMDGTNYGENGGSSAWTTKTGSNSSFGFGGTLINQITVSGTTATLIHNEVISSFHFGSTTYTPTGGTSTHRWQIEIEVSALKNSIRKYYADLVGGAYYAVSRPAANLLLSSSPEPAQTNTNVTLSGSIGALGGGTSHPRQYKVNFDDGTDSGWLPVGGYSYGTTNPSFEITKQYSAAREYYPSFITIPDYSSGSTTVTVSAALSAPSPTGVLWNGTSFILSYTGGSGPWFQSWYRLDNTTYPANGTGFDSGSATQNTTTITYTPGFTPTPGGVYYFWVRSAASSNANTAGTVSSYSTNYVQVTIPAQSYNVTWNGNGGSTGNEGTPWSFTAGGTVTVPSVSRMGHTFERWADTSSGSYTYTTTGGTFSPPAQDITMYARWQINVCTIPNVIGMTEYNASNALNNAGFAYEYTYYVNTSDASLNGTVQSVDPGVGTQPGCGSNVALTIYQYVAAPVKLSTPTGVNATDDRTDGSNVTWNAVSGASYYGIWWGGQPGYDTAPDFPNIYATSYLDTAITVGNTRAYYVQAYASGNPAGTKSDWSSYEVGSRVNPSPTITYGECTTYGSPYYSTSGYECYGTYSYAYNDNYYYQRRQILSNGTWNGSYDYSCGNTSLRTYGSISEVNGQCGYSPQPVCISYKYVCKYYDAYNSNSNNYSTCYYEGECAANNNSDGSRSTCCAAYS